MFILQEIKPLTVENVRQLDQTTLSISSDDDEWEKWVNTWLDNID